MILTGLDRLLAAPSELQDRRYALLSHAAALAADLRPAHLALAEAAAPAALLLAPEHGLFGAEQDMVATDERRDPWTGSPIVSLYGGSEETLRPAAERFSDIDVLIIDLQDVGCRYYTYTATAVWAAEAALAAAAEVWVLDRPNPLGGEAVEGNLVRPGFESFVSAFRIPVRHGLTLAELLRLEARRRGWSQEPRVWPMAGWERTMTWVETARPWIAPSPNMPTPETALLYPGCCLVEATELSEGRGTARPFKLVGAPGIDPLALRDRLEAAEAPGIGFVPTHFRPQYQKHAGQLCGGIELVVTDVARFRPYRFGIELLAACREVAGDAATWRREPYEFVVDRPAIDLLTGDEAYRRSLDGEGALTGWLDSWAVEEERFRQERRPILLYGDEGTAE